MKHISDGSVERENELLASQREAQLRRENAELRRIIANLRRIIAGLRRIIATMERAAAEPATIYAPLNTPHDDLPSDATARFLITTLNRRDAQKEHTS